MTSVGANEPGADELAPIDKLARSSQLVDIIYFEVGARRTPASLHHHESEVPPGGESNPEGAAEAGEQSIQLMIRSKPGRFEVRAKLEFEQSDYVATVDVAAMFAVDESIELTETLRHEFTRRVAFMVLYPYLREALHQAVAKLRVDPPLLALITAEQLQLAMSNGSSEE